MYIILFCWSVILIFSSFIFIHACIFFVFKIIRMLRVHATIYNILRLVPNATSQLFPIIAKYFPYKTRPKELISAYVEQILAVLHYAPSLFANIYELCIRHALQIDVEIRIQDDGNVLLERQQAQAKEEEEGGGEEENIHASNSTIFHMDDEKKEAQQQQEDAEIAGNQNDKPNSSSTTVKVDAMADKVRTMRKYEYLFHCL
jgi:hypothetical protein